MIPYRRGRIRWGRGRTPYRYLNRGHRLDHRLDYRRDRRLDHRLDYRRDSRLDHRLDYRRDSRLDRWRRRRATSRGGTVSRILHQGGRRYSFVCSFNTSCI